MKSLKKSIFLFHFHLLCFFSRLTLVSTLHHFVMHQKLTNSILSDLLNLTNTHTPFRVNAYEQWLLFFFAG